MFQIDRVIYATTRPEEVDQTLQKENRLSLVATGTSFPGVATRIYALPGGGTFEIAYIVDEAQVATTEQGQALQEHIKEQGDSYYGLVLETFDLMRVKTILEENDYPVTVTPVQEVIDQNGEKVIFQMLGTFSHLPWFIKYQTPRKHPEGFPQAAIIRTSTLSADVAILEKILESSALLGNLPTMTTASIPMINGSLRLESADEYGFSYLSPTGLVLDTMDRYQMKNN